jgi:hypothetical protein
MNESANNVRDGRRCLGRTKNLRRCGRIGDWKLFCPDHRFQPLLAGIPLVLAIIGLTADLHTLFPWLFPNRGQTELRQDTGTSGGITVPTSASPVVRTESKLPPVAPAPAPTNPNGVLTAPTTSLVAWSFVNSMDHPLQDRFGQINKIAGIPWRDDYVDTRLIVGNPTDDNYEDLDLRINLYKLIHKVGKVDGVADCSFNFENIFANANGPPEESGGFRIRCPVFPRKSSINVLMAVSDDPDNFHAGEHGRRPPNPKPRPTQFKR